MTEPSDLGTEPVDLGTARDIPALRLDEREPAFLRRGAQSLRETFRDARDYRQIARTPYGLTPVLMFVVLGILSGFNGRIFGQAQPEIIKDLDITLVGIISALNIAGFFLTFASVGLGYVADRVRRVPMVAIGAILNGIASVFTGTFSRSVPTLATTLAVADVADTVSDAPGLSLFSDYYPPEVRGKVFALARVIGGFVGLAAPLTVAFLFERFGWRFAYRVAGPLLVIAGVVAWLVLKEPVRGYMERRSLGLEDEAARAPEDPPSFGEAWRTIWSIRTLRRLFLSDIPGGIGSGIFGSLWVVFLFERYGLSVSQRAVLGTVIGAVVLPFGFMSGGLVDVLVQRRPSRVLVLTGVLGVASSLFLFVATAGVPLWILYGAFTIFGALGALLSAATAVLYAQILPAHVRGLGASVGVLASLPATFTRGLLLIYLLTRYGTQGALIAASPFVLLSAILQLSAAGFFERDMRVAIASQAASEEWRRSKAAGTGKMLVCRDVDVDYDGVQVLFNVDFDVEEGQLIALLGTNGAGKSTLLRAIAGVREASAGAIVFNGRDVTHMPPQEIARRGVVLMPGGRGVFPSLTVRENLRLGNWMTDPAEADSRLDEVFAIFPILHERLDERAGVLSGGEQQMLSLSQAFLCRPDLLMIDELSLGLAPAVVDQLLEIVRRIHERGTTIILVEQSVNVALTVCERAVFMEKGEIRFVGPTAELLDRPDILRAVYVRGTTATAVADSPARRRRAYELEERRTILEVREVSRSFGGVRALDGVSIALRDGEVLGLIGPNGAGKTTLFDVVSGYQRQDAGDVLFDGSDVSGLGPDERARLGLVRRFQDARLFGSLSVYENLLVALDRALDVRSAALTALQVPQVRASERRVRVLASRFIEMLELGAHRDKLVRELSTGLRRITDLACVLASEPKVLLLDEPSTGIAQAESEGLAPLLRRVRHQTGCSILIIEHDMPLISAVSDELVAMDQGRVVVRGSPAEVLDDERVIEAYLGTSQEAIARSGARS